MSHYSPDLSQGIEASLPMTQGPSDERRIVIMGCDALGVSVATSLTAQGHIVHVLDRSPEAFDRLPSGEIEDRHIVPIVGGSVVQRDLLKAHVQDVDVFMALSDDESRNALAAQIAKRIFNVPLVICRIEDPVKQQMYSALDLVAISATTVVKDMILEVASS